MSDKLKQKKISPLMTFILVFLGITALCVLSFLCVIGIASAGSLALYENVKNENIVEDTSKSDEEQISIQLTLKNGDEVKNYEINYKGQKNTFEALQLLEEQNEDFTFGYAKSDLGVFITSFNNIDKDISDFWKFQINGEDSNVGVVDYTPEDGDIITFSVEEFIY